MRGRLANSGLQGGEDILEEELSEEVELSEEEELSEEVEVVEEERGKEIFKPGGQREISTLLHDLVSST